MTAYLDYQELFPDTEEIRHLLIQRHPVIPTDRYSLNERYCGDLSCDCRRVLIEVVLVSSHTGLATLSYAFDDDPTGTPDGENPYLEPMRPQGRYAEELLALVANLIETDVPYRERLERHYRQVKRFMADHPDHELHGAVAEGRRALETMADRFITEFAGPSGRSSRSRDRAKKRRKRKAQRRSRKRKR